MNKERIVKLRELTGVGMMQANNALVKADGDYNKALEALTEEGMQIARKRTAKLIRHSTIGYYIHHNQCIGVLVEVGCESDITSSAEFFTKFAQDIATHIAVARPDYVAKSDVPEEILKDIDKKDCDNFYKEHCLLEQNYYHDENRSVFDVVMEFIYKNKENVEIKRFVIYEANRKL